MSRSTRDRVVSTWIAICGRAVIPVTMAHAGRFADVRRPAPATTDRTAGLLRERPVAPLRTQISPEIPFGLGVEIDVPVRPATIVVADFDGDGHPDVATAQPSPTGHIVVWSPAIGTFLGGAPATAPLRLESGDFLGSPAIDLVVLSSGSPGMVTVFRGLGDGSFEAETSVPVGRVPTDMAAADLDDDGRLDLVITTQGDSSLYVLPGIPQGFGSPRRTPGITAPRSVAIADEDGDGAPDVQVTLHADSAVRLFRNAGDGTWASDRDVRCGPVPFDARLADLDGDGALDLATAHYPGIEVRRGDGNGDFGPRLIRTLDGSLGVPPVMECANLDGTGSDELLVAHAAGGAAVSWLWVFSATAGAVVEDVRYFVGTGISNSTGGFITALHVADLEGDGGRDVLVGRSIGSRPTLLALRQLNGLAYQGHQEYDLPVSVGRVAVDAVDFELRGRDDLLVSRGERSWIVKFTDQGIVDYMFEITGGRHDFVFDLFGDARPELIRSDGDSTWVSAIGAGGWWLEDALLVEGTHLAFGDYDGDGDPDFAGRAQDGRLQLCAHDGAGSFDCTSYDPLSNWLIDADAGDLDGDGIDDLAVATSQDSVILYRGHASAGFVRWLTLHFERPDPHVGTPRQLLVRDMDGNGRADVILLMGAFGEHGVVHVQLSVGNARFESLPPASLWPEEAWLSPLDVDSDGDLDFASVTHDGTGEGRLQYLLNDGQGILTDPEGPILHGLDTYPRGLAFGRFGTDAAPDIAIGYYASSIGWGQGFGVMLNAPDAPTAVEVSLVQAAALSDRIRIEWLVTSDEFAMLEVLRAVGAGENEFSRVAELHPDGQGHARFDDRDVRDSERYVYRLRNAVTGDWLGAPVEIVWNTPSEFGLSSPQPNPSIGGPVVRFRVAAGMPAELSLHDVAGRRFRHHVIPAGAGGPASVDFRTGRALEPGIYWITLEQGPHSAAVRTVVVR